MKNLNSMNLQIVYLKQNQMLSLEYMWPLSVKTRLKSKNIILR